LIDTTRHEPHPGMLRRNERTTHPSPFAVAIRPQEAVLFDLQLTPRRAGGGAKNQRRSSFKQTEGREIGKVVCEARRKRLRCAQNARRVAKRTTVAIEAEPREQTRSPADISLRRLRRSRHSGWEGDRWRAAGGVQLPMKQTIHPPDRKYPRDEGERMTA